MNAGLTTRRSNELFQEDGPHNNLLCTLLLTNYFMNPSDYHYTSQYVASSQEMVREKTVTNTSLTIQTSNELFQEEEIVVTTIFRVRRHSPIVSCTRPNKITSRDT